jgi:L-seryl-tRNA(Ser) seleniumtransferase
MDVVTFSGDKMLGGPQAGIIVGNKILIDKMKKNPLTRAFRIDKLTLAALEGTLRLYMEKELALKEIPVLKMLIYDMTELNKRAKRLAVRLKNSIGVKGIISIEDEFSEVGGGSMPLHKMPTKVVALTLNNFSLVELEKKLRAYKTPVVARINRDRLMLDVRTIMDDEFEIIEDALTWAFGLLSKDSAVEGGDRA